MLAFVAEPLAASSALRVVFLSTAKPAVTELHVKVLPGAGPEDVGRAGGFYEWVVFPVLTAVPSSCPFAWQRRLG